MKSVLTMLISNGFPKENLKVFHGGGESLRVTPGSAEKMMQDSQPHPHEVKAGIRRHITKICRTKHCADSLFIYLNSPTTGNGNFLLWDFNNNGMVRRQR